MAAAVKTIGWWDFDFDRVEVEARSTAGTPYRRTLAVGMPRIPSEVLYSPFYLYHSVEDAKVGTNFGGTGFFVGYPTGESLAPSLVYAVTNWHVAVRDGASVIRVNKIGGGVDILEFDPSEWEFPPNGADIAVIPHNRLPLRESRHEIVALGLDVFLTKADVANLGVGAGDDVFMIGRFVDHDGAARNEPAARFGNISVMPQIVSQPTGANNRYSFILDVHSRSGYSGSPVFVYRTYGSDLTTGDLRIGDPSSHFIKLLGIHWGQFPEQWEIKEKKKTVIGEVFAHADKRYIEGMSGMTMAVPAWDLREFLDMKKFQDLRNEAIEQIRRVRGLGPVAESATKPTDGNPQHQEDFKALLGEAARKRPQGD